MVVLLVRSSPSAYVCCELRIVRGYVRRRGKDVWQLVVELPKDPIPVDVDKSTLPSMEPNVKLTLS